METSVTPERVTDLHQRLGEVVAAWAQENTVDAQPTRPERVESFVPGQPLINLL